MKNSEEGIPELKLIECPKCGYEVKQLFAYQQYCVECADIGALVYEPEERQYKFVNEQGEAVGGTLAPETSTEDSHHLSAPMLSPPLRSQRMEVTRNELEKVQGLVHELRLLLTVRKYTHVETSLLILLLLDALYKEVKQNTGMPLVAYMHMDSEDGTEISFNIQPKTE